MLLVIAAIATTAVIVWLARRTTTVVEAIDFDTQAREDIDDRAYEVVGDELPPEVRVTSSRHRVTHYPRTGACGIFYVVTAVEYDDLIRVAHRRYPMRDQQRGAPAHELC